MKRQSFSIEELLNLSCQPCGFKFDENQMIDLTSSNFEIVKGEYEADHDINEKYKEIRDVVNKDFYEEKDYKVIVQKIARENHTRTAESKCEKLAKLALKYDLLNSVKNGDIKIVDTIVNLMEGRKERSLVSKVCRYLETWKTDNANFTINDSILRDVLPYYCNKYEIFTEPFRNDMSYSDYLGACNSLREKTDIRDMHQLDFLLWDFYRKDTIRFAIIKQLEKRQKDELSTH